MEDKMTETAERAVITRKEYKLIKTGEFIRTCEQILPNKMCCWKPGQFVVTEDIPERGPVEYQLCAYHVATKKAEDAAAEREDALFDQPPGEDPKTPAKPPADAPKPPPPATPAAHK
jgi:hypothetical protein